MTEEQSSKGGGNTSTENEGVANSAQETTDCVICNNAQPTCPKCVAAGKSQTSSATDKNAEDSSIAQGEPGSTMSWKNYCPLCKESGHLVYHHGDKISSKPSSIDGEISCNPDDGGCGADYCPLCGGEKMRDSDLAGQGRPAGSQGQLEPCGNMGTEQIQNGGGAMVKDTTFEKCIRRICAATDSIFIVENNAAILFPYTDWMAITLNQTINHVPKNHIDPETFEFEYNNEGFYNKVTVPYEGGEVTKQYNALVNTYGELEKIVQEPVADKETAEFIANSLLIQYIRDFNNSCKLRVLNRQAYVGGTFYTVENPFTESSELFYLQAYTTRMQKGQTLYMDLEFKYGPEGAEELGDYQTFGSGGGTTTSGPTGPTGDESAIWADAQKIHYAHGSCSSQDPNEAYKILQPKIGQPDCKADCYGMSAYLYYRFNNEANIPCRVVGDSSHHVVMLFKNNAWQETKEEMRKLEYLFHWKTNQCTNVLLDAPNGTGGTSSSVTSTGGNTAT